MFCFVKFVFEIWGNVRITCWAVTEISCFMCIVSVGIVRKYVLAFSVRVNGRRILTVDSPPTDGSTLPAIHGIRFLSMTWVILGHTYVVGVYMTSKLTLILVPKFKVKIFDLCCLTSLKEMPYLLWLFIFIVTNVVVIFIY